jgi:hypothetical protein
MPIRTILLWLGGAAALVHVASYIMIMAALDRRGYKTNMFLARIYFYKYVRAYKEATEKEAGKPGPLYRISIGAIMLALVFIVAAVLSPKG